MTEIISKRLRLSLSSYLKHFVRFQYYVDGTFLT